MRLEGFCDMSIFPLAGDPINSGAVGSPGALISFRESTFWKVKKSIFKSSQRDWFSTYHTSSSNFCSHEIALRPFTCAQPVIPGLASCRLACREEYRERYCISSGRGPTRLISPRSTLINSGNSSNEVVRSHTPNPVNRSPSESNFPSPSRASVIVLNLSRANGFSFNPGLVCLKKTGDPSFHRTISISAPKSGTQKTAVIIVNAKSKTLLEMACGIDSGLFLTQRRARSSLRAGNLTLANSAPFLHDFSHQFFQISF